MLAHALYPPPANPEPEAGDVHFDDDELWRIGADVDMYTVALHEIGHALGIGHSDSPSAVMYAHYTGPLTGLGIDDIYAIRALYAQAGSSFGDQYEPDDTFVQALPFGRPETHTIAPADDVDFRTFTLTSHADVTLAVIGTAAGDDTLLTLYDASGAVIEVNDDFGGTAQSRIERDRTGGDPLPAGTYYVSIEEAGGDVEIDAYDVTLATVSFPGPDNLEPDDSFAQATPLTTWPAVGHTLSPRGDEDYSVFTLDQLSEVTVEAYGAYGHSDELEMWLYASDGSLVEYAEGPFSARIDRTRAEQSWLPAGTYYVVVGEKGDDEEIAYWLRLDTVCVPYGGDDAYEENDSLATAWQVPAGWLVNFWSLHGSGYQFDDDYYRFDVPREGRHLRVNCGWADLFDIEILDGAGNLVHSSVGRAYDKFERDLARSGTYHLRVFGPNSGTQYGCDIERSWTQPNEPPLNDDFANRAPVPWMWSDVGGDNFVATKELGEPDHAGNAGGGSVWWSWSAPNAGEFTVWTTSSGYSDFDSLLAVYRGSQVDSLELVAENDSGHGGAWSNVRFRAAAGETFAIAVDGKDGVRDTFSFVIQELQPPPPPDPPPPPPPPPTPPVEVQWSSFRTKCKSSGACKVKAKLVVSNPASVSDDAQLTIVLSDDTTHGANDAPVRSLAIPTLTAGTSRKVKLKTTLPATLVPKGKYLIAVATSDAGTHSAPYGPLR